MSGWGDSDETVFDCFPDDCDISPAGELARTADRPWLLRHDLPVHIRLMTYRSATHSRWPEFYFHEEMVQIERTWQLEKV